MSAAPDPSCPDHAGCIAAALDAAEQVCARRGLRLTPLRRRVLEIVWSSHRPIGAYEILGRLAAERGSARPPTIYRALDFLMEAGLAHRVESLNAYIGCGLGEHRRPPQFLICDRCGDAAELADDGLSRAMEKAAAAAGFNPARQVVELHGDCARCQAEAHE